MAIERKALTEEECYLLALIQDDSGIDLAEFLWEDHTADNPEKLFRCWDFQYAWWRNTYCGSQPVKKFPTQVIDQCGRSVGKALKATEPVLTPEGWRPIKDVRPEDLVYGRDGLPHRVTGVYPQGVRDLYEVTLSDGRSVVVDGEHLWTVKKWQRGERTMSTQELMEDGLRSDRGDLKYQVPLPDPIELPPRPQVLDPYLVGALLGGGGMTGSSVEICTDEEIVRKLNLPDGIEVRLVKGKTHGGDWALGVPGFKRGQRHPLVGPLREMGLMGLKSHEKFVPDNYLHGSIEQRKALLAGLLDTDGEQFRNVIFSTASPHLRDAVVWLVRSLGGACIEDRQTHYTHNGERRAGRPSWRLTLQLNFNPYTLKRKRDAVGARQRGVRNKILSIRPVGADDAVCIEVDSPDHLFVAKDFVVTHNTTSIILRAWAFGVQHPGMEMVVAAPELIHLDPLISRIEDRIKETRLTSELLPKKVGRGFKHRPFQCIAEGQYVLTKRGHIPIEEVEVGDEVLTHRNRWRKVLATWDQGIQDVVKIKGRGHPGLTLTPDHKLWARKSKQQATFRTGKRAMKRVPQPPEWINPENWRTKDPAYKWASPAEVKQKVTPLAPFRLNNRGFGVGKGVWIDPWTPEFMWIMGLYLADGCTAKPNLALWSVHTDQVPEVLNRVQAAGLTARTRSPHPDRNALDVAVTNQVLREWIDAHFPGSSHTKDVPTWAYSMPEQLRAALLAGYMFGDGYTSVRGDERPFSVSPGLMYGMKILAQTLGWGVGVYGAPPKTTYINGKPVHGQGGLESHFTPDPGAGKHVHNTFEYGMSWAAMTQIEPAGKAHVYDLTVDEDHSFVVEGIVVSNCSFLNGAKILGRIPQRDGRGVKGCVAEGTLILSEKGYVPAEVLKTGDRILTHTGAWEPIQHITLDIDECYEVKGMSSFPVTVSSSHSFYGSQNLATPKQKRNMTELHWTSVDCLLEDQFYWATPTHFNSLPVPGLEFNGTAKKFEMDSDFWWLIGRYLADGYTSFNKKNGKEARVHWAIDPNDLDEVMARIESLGRHASVKHRDHSSAPVVTVASAAWRRWLNEHCGTLAGGKRVPGFILGLEKEHRAAVLEGYLAGDGHWVESRQATEISSASRALILGMQMLAQGLDYSVTTTSVSPKVTHIQGVKLKKKPQVSWRARIGNRGIPIRLGDHLVAKVKSVTPVGKRKVYNFITEDHSYISESVVSHNIHPLKLEQDEGQDWSTSGWLELIETLRHGQENAQWRSHGVSRGVRDEFYRHSQPGSGWLVHRYTGMHRNTWSDEEREDKIQDYGTRDSPDYKRNILGLHGDATNPLFVLRRLMAQVDDDPQSDYNENVYYSLRINYEQIEQTGIEMLINPPGSHKQWKNTWAGADLGLTSAPTEILIFGEEAVKAKPDPALRLLARFHLERVSSPMQREVIKFLFDHYNFRLFTLDRGGLGLPIYQDLQAAYPNIMSRIKGYTADEKVVVGWEEYEDWENPDDYEIKRQAKEYGYDLLRVFVDQRRLILPWDRELLGEWQGTTWARDKSETNPYGKRIYKGSGLHTLDAAAMMIVGKELASLEALKVMRNEHEAVPIIMI